jgi:hypothetical protein
LREFEQPRKLGKRSNTGDHQKENFMKKLILTALFLAAISAFAADTTTTATTSTTTTTKVTSPCADENHYPIVSTTELKTMLQKKNLTVFDVNGPDSFKKAHVPGAIDFVRN